MISDIKRDIPKFGTVFTRTRATCGEIRKQNSNFHKGLELWAKSINDFGNFERHFPCGPCATSAKILSAMYARVPQAMAQFVLKIEKLSHIMAPTPILEMARAYGLRPRLWLLTTPNMSQHGGQTHTTCCAQQCCDCCVGMLRLFGRGFRIKYYCCVFEFFERSIHSFVAKLSDRCFCWFPAAMLVPM